MDGGALIAEVLRKQGVRFLFTLCGGHISPILVGAKRADIRVIDVRHEVNAVFAADAVARLTGIPGVVAVTAGPGLTNTITAVAAPLMSGVKTCAGNCAMPIIPCVTTWPMRAVFFGVYQPMGRLAI